MPTVYIIRSQQGHVYVGCTSNLQKRLQQHNNHVPFWTKRGTNQTRLINWKLIYHEQFSSLSDARKRERWFKSGVGRLFIKPTNTTIKFIRK